MINELPKLEGSEKQVKWAEDIRRKLIADNPENMDGGPMQSALAITSAKWWIETRNFNEVSLAIAVGEIERGESIWRSIAVGKHS